MPSLLTSLFRFAIVKGRPTLAPATVALIRAIKRAVHTPYVSVSLSHQYRSLRLLGTGFFYGWGKFSCQRTADVSPSPNQLFASQARRRP
ncbi:hypothetical protein DFJ58DRAFT_731103 [Suillus subalutaceus]|uniref:uncharacterized protein n=1 Tax=Suillus subalutaceus TaxID=48586 RepID=UPI001B86B5F6|nr:uncharacterized protein DFJ58DRAFT_731103 [Suillus subalutaceus]KAG1844834.1 hypothetical protein DFJ58DRAFT_731103 [Suillus subalutaceus]